MKQHPGIQGAVFIAVRALNEVMTTTKCVRGKEPFIYANDTQTHVKHFILV